MADEPQEQAGAGEKKPFRPGVVVDFVVPVALTLIAFFGIQANINSGGAIRVQLGMGMLLKLSFICILLYTIIIKRVLKAIWPRLWGG